MKIHTKKLNIYDTIEIKNCEFKQHSFPLHFHDTISIGIITKGFEQLYINNKWLTAPTNTVAIINAKQVHANTFFDKNPWAYSCVYINQDAIKFVLKKKGINLHDLNFTNNLIENDYLLTMIGNICKTDQQEINVGQINIETLIEYLALNCTEKRLNNDKFTNDNYMYDCIDKMDHNFTNKFDLNSLSSAYGLSKFQFIRKFKTYTGLSPSSYIIMKRVTFAKEQLALGVPVNEVAFSTGFYDHAHFNKYFKRYVGVNPQNYLASIDEY